MNQDGVEDDGGTFYNGALVIDFPGSKTVKAHRLFASHQPIPGTGTVDPRLMPTEDSAKHFTPIVAAMINPPANAPCHKFVTILDSSLGEEALTDWKILDQHDKAETIGEKKEPK